MSELSAETRAAIEERREQLENVAESDLPVASIARKLLDLVG